MFHDRQHLVALGNSYFVLPFFNVLVRSVHYITLGRVVRKPVNTNPGLKVKQSYNFPCMQMFFTAYILCSLI